MTSLQKVNYKYYILSSNYNEAKIGEELKTNIWLNQLSNTTNLW
jgi:hypothetical protein